MEGAPVAGVVPALMSFYQGATSGLDFAHAIHVVSTDMFIKLPLPVGDPDKASFPRFVLYRTSDDLLYRDYVFGAPTPL